MEMEKAKEVHRFKSFRKRKKEGKREKKNGKGNDRDKVKDKASSHPHPPAFHEGGVTGVVGGLAPKERRLPPRWNA